VIFQNSNLEILLENRVQKPSINNWQKNSVRGHGFARRKAKMLLDHFAMKK